MNKITLSFEKRVDEVLKVIAYMEQKKGFIRRVCGELFGLLEDSKFHIWFLFFFLPHALLFFCLEKQ